MENNNRESNSNSRSSSFRLGLGMNEAKVHTVVELGGFETKSTKSLLCDVGDFEESEKQQQQQKQLPLKNSLSSRQMKSLVALCDTMLPSIIDNNVVASSDEYVNNFYRISASMAGTPERVTLQ
ncbi:long-chain-alcohol oxidase FAO4A-like [Trifolium medium]|uniref:Long-chain-alcohol oxidase FAO4A-like n=1 Tax=Trifolium medium TaxID=97028 RepID=A0A392MSX9_9FABA|nr:long-chain-alcohol oxidase FAO4A-like [Trifolium medium]